MHKQKSTFSSHIFSFFFFAPSIQRMAERAYSVNPVHLSPSNMALAIYLSFSGVRNLHFRFSSEGIHVIWTHFYFFFLFCLPAQKEIQSRFFQKSGFTMYFITASLNHVDIQQRTCKGEVQSTLFIQTLDTTTKFVILTIRRSQNLRSRSDS